SREPAASVSRTEPRRCFCPLRLGHGVLPHGPDRNGPRAVSKAAGTPSRLRQRLFHGGTDSGASKASRGSKADAGKRNCRRKTRREPARVAGNGGHAGRAGG